jgi:hypothetical protein
LQRGLAIAAGGHRLDQADGQPTVAEDRVEVQHVQRLWRRPVRPAADQDKAVCQ